MLGYFKNKIALVTGASRGIGRALVEELLHRGAIVAGLSRNTELLMEISAKSAAEGLEFMAVPCDITDEDSVKKAVSRVIERYGKIDILVNNAGQGFEGYASQFDRQKVERCFEVNFYGAVNCVRFIVPHMVKSKNGIIVNVASVVARYGLPTVGYYSAAKAALSAYSQALRAELAPSGISVITAYPGNTETDFQKNQISADVLVNTAARKGLKPAYVAAEIVSAIEKGKNELVIGRPAKILLLLKSLLPSLTERIIRKEFKLNSKQILNDKLVNPEDESLIGGIYVRRLDGRCRYHRYTGHIGFNNVVPKGVSPLLLYFIYPYMLSTVYGGKAESEFSFLHPASRKKFVVMIKNNPPDMLEKFKNLIKTLLLPVMPMGRIKSMPEIIVDGEIYPFDLGRLGTTCPAALRSLFPLAAAYFFEEKKGAVAWEACCPDHLKNITFGSPEGSLKEEFACHWGSSIEITPLSACENGRVCQAGSIDEIAAKLGVPCPMLFNVAYGYYLTLSNGGELAFYSRSMHAAIFQCPNSGSRVVAEVSKKKDNIEFKVLDIVGSKCPKGIVKGSLFYLPSDNKKTVFCTEAFNSIFFYSGLSEVTGIDYTVNCIISGCKASWRVGKKC